MTKEEDRELEVSIVAAKLGLSDTSVRRLMSSGLLRYTTRGPKKGYRVFESSVVNYKQQRDQQACV
jgi:DNA-binding transcriptional MerR regulator